MLPLQKLKSLERLDLCSTWHPLFAKVSENEDGLDVSGSREFERVFWSLRPTLKELRLGNFMWDDMLVYVAEMCRNLEVFQINSQECTDGSINHMIRKCTKLRALDVSGLVKFVGLAF